MAIEFELVLRGGTVIDGTGGPPYLSDIGITGGRIAAIGRDLARGAEEIEARDKIITPGFVDVHTHYDAQATWSSRLTPSSWNGVTTVLLGNCGVGFAPCLPERRDMLVKLMEGVEDIPEVVLTEGLPWSWQSFPEFLDALAVRPYDIDIAAQVPHAALRVHVMGERGAAREPATEADRTEMARLAAEGIRAGALGFSTSRTLNHRTLAGEPTPTLNAAEAELRAIAEAVGEAGTGWLQVVSDFDEPDAEFDMLRRLVAGSGRPMTITLLQNGAHPDEWRRLLDRIGDANRDGLRMTGQVRSRPTSVLLSFELSQNPFMGRPSYKRIAHLPFPERLAALRTPAFRARLLDEAAEDDTTDRAARRAERWAQIFPLGDPPEYEPAPEDSIAARAARVGQAADELAYDIMLQRDGRTILYLPVTNYVAGNLDVVREMMSDPHTLLGLGDGGAHVGIMCDATATSYTLTHWTRDRARGGLFPLAWAVKRLTHDNAAAIGLDDRGLIRAGRKADINVIDYDRMALRAPEMVYDMPAGGKRLIQRTDGFVATIVSGVPIYREGQPTGALPGRLVRGIRKTPTAGV